MAGQKIGRVMGTGLYTGTATSDASIKAQMTSEGRTVLDGDTYFCVTSPNPVFKYSKSSGTWTQLTNLHGGGATISSPASGQFTMTETQNGDEISYTTYTKDQLDTNFASYLPLTGGNLTGSLSMTGTLAFNISIAATPSATSSIYQGDSAGKAVLKMVNANGLFLLNNKKHECSVGMNSLTANRVFNLPDAHGTFALTSDITTAVSKYLPLAGGTITGDLNLNNGSRTTPAIKFSDGIDYLTLGKQDIPDTGLLLNLGVHDDAKNANYQLCMRNFVDGTTYSLTLPNTNGTFATQEWVTNTAIAHSAATATKLATARTIALSGGATGTATAFDGTSNINIPITSLDATKLIGTASISTTGNAATANNAATVGSLTTPSGTGTIATTLQINNIISSLVGTSNYSTASGSIISMEPGAEVTYTVALPAGNLIIDGMVTSDSSVIIGGWMHYLLAGDNLVRLNLKNLSSSLRDGVHASVYYHKFLS